MNKYFRNFLIFAVVFTSVVSFLVVVNKKQPPKKIIPFAPVEIKLPEVIVKEVKKVNPTITNVVPTTELTYEEVNSWLDEWYKSDPDITEVGIVGKHNQYDIKYIRIGNKKGPKVLITAAIHGNEKLSTMTMMGVVGKLLDAYMDDGRITTLFEERDIYFVPIVSPEGYVSNRRHTMGLDPNRNWTEQNLVEKESIPCVQAMKDFHKKHNFKAVMSCHNHARLFFYPWGYTRKSNELEKEYRSLLSEMTKNSGYTFVQLYGRSAPPYYGYEVDWYHNHGAFSLVNEIGRSFRAGREEVAKEVKDNYESTIIFIEKAPLVRK